MKIRSGILSLINLLVKPDRLLPGLIHAQIEPCNFCNLHCKMCMWETVPVPKTTLGMEGFERILSEVKPGFITFSGYGEPLLNRELEEMIRVAKSRGIVLNTTTNGVLLEERAESLIQSGLDLISVSLDAPNPELYREIRNTDAFEQVLRGIRRFLEIRRRLRTPNKLRVSLVIQGSNLEAIPPFLTLVKELGVDGVLFQMLEPFDKVLEQGLHARLTEGRLKESLMNALRISREMRLPTNLPALIRDLPLLWGARFGNRENSLSCKMIWFSTMVSCHGDVRPCCRFASESFSCGNLLKGSFSEVMNGPKMTVFRNHLRAGHRPHPICRSCVPLGYGDIFLPAYERF